ncbi:hypothetical protein [Emiliania huxleyi virus 99B1]|nr:hypothetical protein EhVM1_000428 [Emiliania huxleyi virus M1]CAZ69748.1 hypothetical protein [Emiliania huxleyi virus 99B1]|mmetsp:Transcript_22819/g.65196  ORF Transcript_22819/g.65196 Transcript_22819/m.65196 type:complete len:299 (+) Transcript_22819:166-1062(+)
MTDFSAELSDNSMISRNFEKTSGSGSRLPFKDTKQTHVLFSISHVGVPPIATDPTNPAIRIYGTFGSAAAAAHYGKKIMTVDPTCHLGICETHSWTLAASNINYLQDPDYIKTKTEKLMKRADVENSVREARFKQHQEELRNATIIKDEKPITAEKMEDATPTEPTIEEVVDNNLPVLTSDCIPINQSVYCISVINDDPVEDVPEFLFYIYRTCRDEAEADGYVRNVASRNVLDHNIYVVDSGEWVFPVTDIKFAPRTYRDKRLNDLMNRDMSPDELLAQIDENVASNASGAVLENNS